MIYERLILIKQLLATDGSIYVHCDWRLNSTLSVILDEIFGSKNFRRELVWFRDNPTGGKSTANNFIHSHDTILYY